MRGALLVALLIVLFMPACSAIPPKIPDITLTVSPSSLEVTSSPNQTVMAYFNGTVTLDKLPAIRITVSLAASTGTNWSCSCEPSTIVIADELPHPFTCNVTVPEAAQNQTTTLTVDAIGTGIGFEHTYGQAEATIVVHGTAPINKIGGTGGKDKTGTNQTAPNNTHTILNGSSFKLGPLDATSLTIIVVVVVAAAAFGGYFVHHRSRARRRSDYEQDEPVEEVEAL